MFSHGLRTQTVNNIGNIRNTNNTFNKSDIATLIINGNLEQLKKINKNELVNFKDEYDNNVMHLAAQSQNNDIIYYLLHNVENVNTIALLQNKFGQTPRNVALFYNNENFFIQLTSFNIEILKDENKALKMENARAIKIQNDNTVLTISNNKLQKTISSNETKHNELKKIIIEISNNSEILIGKNNTLICKYDEISKKNKDLVNQNKTFTNNIKRLRNDNDELDRKNKKMKMSIDTMMSLNKK